jgi:hypothetical protein
MLSNQMRGRAIRRLPGRPEKTANVWHLVCVEPGALDGGEDFETLERRFTAFVGVSAERPVIENGIERLGLGKPPFGGLVGRPVDEINRLTLSRARDRAALRRLWENALHSGSGGHLVDQLRASRARVPRSWTLRRTISALFAEGVGIAIFALTHGGQALEGVARSAPGRLLTAAFVILAIAIVLGLPVCVRAVWLALRHGRIESSMREVGSAVLDSLGKCGIIRTPRERLVVASEMKNDGTVVCYIEGGTSAETSAFLGAMRQLLSPIENPRYLLERVTPGSLWLRRDYHAVPEMLAARKEFARTFLEEWRSHVGWAVLRFTRSVEGRLLLVRARNSSVSGALDPRPSLVARWK